MLERHASLDPTQAADQVTCWWAQIHLLTKPAAFTADVSSLEHGCLPGRKRTAAFCTEKDGSTAAGSAGGVIRCCASGLVPERLAEPGHADQF